MTDRLDKYLKKYLDDYVFLELMPEYVKREHLDFMRNVPMPVKKEVVEELAADKGIEFKYFTMGMISIIGINPSFKFTTQYINFLNYVNKDIVKAIVMVAIEQAKQRELDQACISLRAALTINSEDPDALYNYILVCRNMYEADSEGSSQYVLDLKEEAFASLQKLRDVKPDFDMTYYYLGFTYLNAGQYLQSQQNWERFMELSQHEEERKEIAARLMELKEPVEIEKGYRDIVAGRYAEGLEVLERFKGSSHMKWWPLPYYLGVGYSRTDRPQEALEMLKAALKGNPSGVEIMTELVLVNNALGDEVGAEKYKKKIDLIRNQK